MRVMVLGGVGAVAKETTRDLLYNSSFKEIVIADWNIEKAGQLAGELESICRDQEIPEGYRCEANKPDFYNKKISTLQVDASEAKNLVPYFKEMDIVACGLPFEFDLPVTEAAATAGVNALDLSFADEQMNFHEQAKAKNITYIPGVGATPGITNVMARKGVEQLDRADEVHINFAAYRCLAPAPGLIETTFWEFDPATKERVYYQDGEMISVPPFTGEQKARFHDLIGEQTVVYIPHPETSTISKSYPGLKHVNVRGTFPPHVMRLMRSLLESGILSHEEINHFGQKTTPYKAMQQLLLVLPESKQNETWAYGLVVEVKGEKDGKPLSYIYRNQHPSQDQWGGIAAYYKNVGIPLAIGAEMLGRGEIEVKGVIAPELAIKPEPFFKELAARKIEVVEEVLE